MLNIKFFEEKAKEGFDFPFILIYPSSFNKRVKIFIEANNSVIYEEQGQDSFVSQIEYAINYAKHLTTYQDGTVFNMPYLYQLLNQTVVIPIIERCDKKYSKEFYTQMLGRNVVLEKQGKFANLASQVVSMANFTKRFLEKQNIKVEEKFGALGMSASGVFAGRLVFIEPEHFDICLSVCSNAVQPLPLQKLHNVNLPYPLGTYDYQEIFGKPFNEKSYQQIKQLFIVGEDENSEVYDISHNPRLHDAEIQNLYTKVYGNVSIQDRQKILSNIFHEQGFKNVKCVVADGGHSLSGKGRLITTWAKHNVLDLGTSQQKNT